MAETKEILSQLMRSALEGDQKAYGLLLSEAAHMLRPYLMRRMSRKQDIEDVLQEILISVHKARHTYDGKRPFGPWLYAIAHFRLQDYFRKHYADPLRAASELETAENISNPDVTESGFTYESIQEEVNQLPGKAPTILRLIHSEGYTAKEVAEKIGMKESAVKVAAHRAYKVLKQKLSR